MKVKYFDQLQAESSDYRSKRNTVSKSYQLKFNKYIPFLNIYCDIKKIIYWVQYYSIFFPINNRIKTSDPHSLNSTFREKFLSVSTNVGT